MPNPLFLAGGSGAGAGGGLAALGALGSIVNSRKLARTNRRINNNQKQTVGIQNALARRNARAQARQLQAAVRAQALAAGVGLSSGEDNAISGVTTQRDTGIAVQERFQDLDFKRFQLQNRANRQQTNASTFDQLGSLGGSISSL